MESRRGKMNTKQKKRRLEYHELLKPKMKKESFMQGVMVLLFSQIAVKIIGIIYKIYLTNKPEFGDTGNAIYNSGFQIYILILTLASVGVPNAISKLISEKMAVQDQEGAHQLFKVSFLLFSGIGLLGSIALFLGAHYISHTLIQIPEAELTIKCLSPSIFFVAISAVIRGYFNGQSIMSVSANSQTIEQIVKTIFTIIIVEIISFVAKDNIEWMAGGANLATTLSVCVSFSYLYKYYRYQRKVIECKFPPNEKEISEKLKSFSSSKQIIKNVLSISIPVSLGSIISAINKNIDSITVVRGLKTFLTEDVAKFQFGIYSGKVDTLIGFPLSFNIPFTIALVPAIANSIAKDKKEIGMKRLSFCLMLTMLMGIPCTIEMLVFAQPILDLLFPNASSGGSILQISSLTIIFTLLAQTVNAGLQGIGKYKVPAISLGIGVGIKFILNSILISIPSIGIHGVAISSVVCQILSFVIGYVVLKKETNLRLSILKFFIKPIIATIVMVIISYFIYSLLLCLVPAKISTIIILIFSILIYVILVFLFKILEKEDIFMLPYGSTIYKVLKKIKLYQ